MKKLGRALKLGSYNDNKLPIGVYGKCRDIYSVAAALGNMWKRRLAPGRTPPTVPAESRANNSIPRPTGRTGGVEVDPSPARGYFLDWEVEDVGPALDHPARGSPHTDVAADG